MNSAMSPGSECGGQASGKVAPATSATGAARSGSVTVSTITGGCVAVTPVRPPR